MNGDPRLDDIARMLERLVAASAGSDTLTAVERLERLAGTVAERVSSMSRYREEVETRLESLVEIITAMAAIDFSRRAPVSERADALDAVAVGINMLQEELQHTMVSRRYLDDILRSMTDMVVVIDESGAIRVANDTFVETLGYTRDQVVGWHFGVVCTKCAAQAPCAAVRETNGNVSAPCETTFRGRDGREVPVSCSGRRMAGADGVGQTVCAAQDITERKRAERFIRQQSEHNRLRGEVWRLAASDDIDEKVLVRAMLKLVAPALGFDRASFSRLEGTVPESQEFVTEYVWCAPGVADTTGVRIPARLVLPNLCEGARMLGIADAVSGLPPEVRAEAQERFATVSQAFQTAVVVAMPLVVDGNVDGVCTFDILAGRRLEDEESGLIGGLINELFSILAGAVSRRRAVLSLAQAKVAAEELAARAQEASLAKSQFISVVSHEIRTPMTAIVGMTQAIEMTTLSDEQCELVGVMREAEDMLMGLLNSVLDLSRAETGRIVLERTELDVRRIVEQRVTMNAGAARSKHTVVTAHVDDAVPAILLGDPLRFGQILANLLGNAVKFTHGGRVELTVGVAIQTPTACTLACSVADTGVGIPADKIDQVFEVFSQADASTTRRYGGSGLGLAICRRLVEIMGGQITVTSEEGKGSVFGFTVRFEMPDESC